MKHWKWLLRLVVTGLLLYWVLSRIDREGFARALVGADISLLLVAVVPYVFSRITSASRLTILLNASGVPLTRRAGLRLHWISMFYGMFLPGGLGGDAYKLFRLKQDYPDRKALLLSKALLWDRIVGFAMLGLLAVLLAAVRFYDQSHVWGIVGMGAVVIAVFRIAAERFLHGMGHVVNRLLILSALTQVGQIICINILLQAIGSQGHLIEYILIFLLSSIAAMFPLSVGGIGVRELVFMKGAEILGTSEHVAVTASVLFDIIVTLTAITGAFLVIGKAKEQPAPQPAALDPQD